MRIPGQTLKESAERIKQGTWTNRLKESVERDKELGPTKWAEMVKEAESNKLLRRFIKEGLLSDMAQALGVAHDVVIQAAQKMAVGREIIWIVPTTEPLVRFYLRSRSSRWAMADGPSLVVPGRHTTVDIELDKEWGQDALFSKSYIEDTPYAVLEQEVGEMGQLLEEGLCTDVLTLYDSVAEADLAGGANVDVTSSGTLAWEDIVKAWKTMQKAGRTPDFLVIHPDEAADLWADDKFIHQFYFGSMVDVSRGILGTSYLGFKILETDLFPTTDYAYMVDLNKASACILRRDITPEPYKEKLKEGLIATMRYGMKMLDPTGLVRIDITP